MTTAMKIHPISLSVTRLAMRNLQVPWFDHLPTSAQHDLLLSVSCCLLLDSLLKETTCKVMVDHLQSRGAPWHQCANHVKVAVFALKRSGSSAAERKSTAHQTFSKHFWLAPKCWRGGTMLAVCTRGSEF